MILKYTKEYTFYYLLLALYKPPFKIPYSKNELRYFGGYNLLLLLNFFLISSLTMYMIMTYYNIHVEYAILLPTGYYFFRLLSHVFVGAVSGVSKDLGENIFLTNTIAHIIGVISIPFLLAWILNPQYSIYFIVIFVFIFGLLHIAQIWRGFFIALRNNIRWYYIILYLCTLEILPIILIYMLYKV
ncbi:MAG: DUF4271 domain-containing protein [Brumimicrobium sp.]|nr:DUF4271 domain-containing protein [Brumimicrobium sp.]MCO5269798.1 DUF4271 domain-containing protein [Brumimicrobium sp.]